MTTRKLTVPVTAHVELSDVERLEAAVRARGVTRASYLKQLIRADVDRIDRQTQEAAASM